MHEVELGDIKRIFAHLIRMLYALGGPESVAELNSR